MRTQAPASLVVHRLRRVLAVAVVTSDCVGGSEAAFVTVEEELLLDVPTDEDGPAAESSSELHRDCVRTCTSKAVPI